MDKLKKAHIIIHTSAVASAGFALALAQGALFGADTPFLTVITIGMIVALGALFNKSIKRTTALAFLGTWFGSIAGVQLAKAVLGFLPLLGNVANAGITLTLTETIGWTVYLILNEGENLENLSDDEIKKFKEKAKIFKEEVSKKYDFEKQLPEHTKLQYDNLVSKLKDKNISDDDRKRIYDEIEELIEPYIKS